MQYQTVEAFERDPDPIVTQAEAGETIVLTRAGVPVLRLEPARSVVPEFDD